MKQQKITTFKFNTLSKIVPLISHRILNKEFICNVLHNHVSYCLNVLKLHLNYQFKVLSCISGVDLIGFKYRFCVSYEVISLSYNTRFRIKTFVDEVTPLSSLTSIFINSDWFEREIWDLYGIYFNGHKDLRRILTDYGFEGFPLRKDFPLTGYTESRYNERKKRVISDRIQLTQEYRLFYSNLSFNN